MQLSSIDLNLLVALDALLQEGNVTRAGQRIGLSQPAMSRALSRLRELLDDPILVRRGSGMQVTPRAERLRSKLKVVLDQIHDTLFDEETFDPATCRRQFTIAATDYCGLVILPRLIAHMNQVAPGVDVRVRPQNDFSSTGQVIEGLMAGTIDVAVGKILSAPEEIACQDLFRDGFVCALRRGHPAAGQRLTLERFCQLGHVLPSTLHDGPGVVDAALARHGLERRVVVRVPHFLVAPAIVAATDLVTTLAKKLAEHACRTYDLSLCPPPLELPTFPVSMLWNRMAESDAGLAWLRQLLVTVTARFRETPAQG